MKRIIACSDGTWNRPNKVEEGQKIRTNVQKIFDYMERRDKKEVIQLKYYDEGIGAQGNKLTQYFNGATGRGIDENIQDVYKIISWNYIPGDEIFLFGFSRGAYTARSVAGFIHKCGILKSNDLELIGEAYKLYRNTKIHAHDPKAKEFRDRYSYPPIIKFIGVWDTVGSLGLPLHWFQWYNKKRYAFCDVKLSEHIDQAYHALAVDEKRKTFLPTLWKQKEEILKLNPNQVLQQRWFPGVHSNVGGGYAKEGLADISLEWMIEKAREAGICFDEEWIKNDVKPDHKDKLYDSRSLLFKLMPAVTRHIHSPDDIHRTVHLRIKDVAPHYMPPNVFKAEKKY